MDRLPAEAPRAKERLQQIDTSLSIRDLASTIRLQLHIIRLQKRLRSPEMSPLINWSTIPRTIESRREQWSCLQQVYSFLKM